MAEKILEIKNETSPEVTRRIKAFIRSGDSFKVPLKKIGLQLTSSVQQNFDAGGRPKKWPGLKLATLLQRGAEPGGSGRPEILRDKGFLMASIISASTDPSGIWILEKFQVTVGSKLKYAGHIQDGTKFMPPRPFLIKQDEDVVIAIKFIEEHVMPDG